MIMFLLKVYSFVLSSLIKEENEFQFFKLKERGVFTQK